VPVNVRAEAKGQTVTLRWEANARGERPAKYEVYGSDEKGFSVDKGPHDVKGLGNVPGNLLGETTGTSMVVASPTATEENANKVFYRVVAIDADGTASGCSDYAELAHPSVCSEPVTQAAVGKAYRYEVRSLRSLGDYQCRQDPDIDHKQYAHRFWNIEENAYELAEGPKWLGIDGESGVLTGTPAGGDVGTARVKVRVTNQYEGQAEQEFTVRVR